MRPRRYLPGDIVPAANTGQDVRDQARELLTTWAGWTGAGSSGTITIQGLGSVRVELDR